MDFEALAKKYKRDDLVVIASKLEDDRVGYPTGIPYLDSKFSIGGIPGGRITEFFGPPSSGKTSLTLSTIAELHNNSDELAALVDTEHAWDREYTAKCGVDLDRLYLVRPEWGEQAFDAAEVLIRSGKFSMVVVDSVPALSTRAEVEGDVGDAHVGLLPRLMSQFLRRTAFAIRQSGVAVIFTNQVRDKINPRVPFKQLETPGGYALKHHSSVRLSLYNAGQVKTGDGEVIGSQINFTIKKSKIGPSSIGGSFQIWNDRGVYKEDAVLELALQRGIIKQRGSWFVMDGDSIAQGRVSTVRALTGTDLYGEILGRLKDEKVV